jgi:hypothetical protein
VCVALSRGAGYDDQSEQDGIACMQDALPNHGRTSQSTGEGKVFSVGIRSVPPRPARVTTVNVVTAQADGGFSTARRHIGARFVSVQRGKGRPSRKSGN